MVVAAKIEIFCEAGSSRRSNDDECASEKIVTGCVTVTGRWPSVGVQAKTQERAGGEDKMSKLVS
jgi:hypothetical protein